MRSAFLAYTVLVVLSELTLGNSRFPVYFWSFSRYPAWFWSAPVHLLGYGWIVLVFTRRWSWMARAGSAVVYLTRTAASLAFFVIAETLNLTWLHVFTYTRGPFGILGSFLAILGLYAALCAITGQMLTRCQQQPRGR